MIFNILMKPFLEFSPIQYITKKTSPIVLYHAIFENIPEEMRIGLDNVAKDTIYNQLSDLKKYYNVVSIDEYYQLKNKNGYACVTFDDAYKNVIDNGLSIIEELSIPITIFVNTSTLEKKVFWRDKIRYIVNNNLIDDFERYSNTIKKVENKSFYKYTKMNMNNSRKIEIEIDNFFKFLDINTELDNYCISNKRELIKHNLVYYGNHTHNHYVLSSLSFNEQYEEISKTKEILDNIDVNKSNFFSLPFGGDDDYNDDTIKIVKALGYDGILMSRNRINYNKNNTRFFLYERFMPMENRLSQTLKKLFFKELLLKINS